MRRTFTLLALGLSVHWVVLGCQSARRPPQPIPVTAAYGDAKSVVAEIGEGKNESAATTAPSLPPDLGRSSAIPAITNAKDTESPAAVHTLPATSVANARPRTPPQAAATVASSNLPVVLPPPIETKPVTLPPTLVVTPPVPAVAPARNGITIISGKMDAPVVAKMPPVVPSVPKTEPVAKETIPAKGTTLTGHVESWRKTLRLRYAGVEIEDPHGGSIVLVGDNLSKLQEGQHIRVEGQLLAGDDQNGRRFVVQSFQVVQ